MKSKLKSNFYIHALRLLMLAVLFDTVQILPANAASTTNIVTGPVLALPTEVYDGDTFTFDALVWPGMFAHSSVRVLGVDTPEMRGKCPDEIAKAHQAKAFVENALKMADKVELKNIQTDKYGGRVEADVFIDGENLADILIRDNLGRPYHGEKRAGWCN